MTKIITVPFTEEFLPRVVDYLCGQAASQGPDLSRTALVFGGRRPALFIKKMLGLRIGKAFVPPRFYTIDEWMAYMAYGSRLPVRGSDLDHAYTIYRLAKRMCPAICHGRETFVQFLPWAREILHFIEQLDLEDVPLDSLKILQEHARIGFSVPQDINKLLIHLSALRGAFHEELEKKSLAPRAYQYAQAARRAPERDLAEFEKIVFCNFFYLHRTENAVIKNIFDRGQAVLFMQGDERRWPALSRIGKTYGVAVREGAEVKPTKFNLEIYEAPDSHAQAGLLKDILAGIKDHESTVIVLPDSGFLPVLLTAVGGQLGEFNVSMGYPLKRSSLYSLLTLVLDAQRRRREGLYYARDYLGLLQHPLVNHLGLSSCVQLTRLSVLKIREALTGQALTAISGRLFLDVNEIAADEKLMGQIAESAAGQGVEAGLREIKETIDQIHAAFLTGFENIRTTAGLASSVASFVDTLQNGGGLSEYPFNSQMAARMLEICDELKASALAQETFEPGDLFKIFEELLSSQLVAFRGSPLRGLQILGLFETRALNFKNVIVADVNEGILPSLNIYEPLIPREVLIKLNLDRLELEEEIQRYGFMRLISAAENVHLVYQKNHDRSPSRFIEELIWEKEQRLGIGGVVIRRGAFEVSVARKPRSVTKTPEIIRFLKQFKFSASSLDAYLQNPYEFYCRYCLGLRPADNLLEDPQSRHVGIYVHGLLQKAFEGFLSTKPILDGGFRHYFAKLHESSFDEVFKRAGRNDTFLMETVLKARLERFLDVESVRCAREVGRLLHLERKFEDTLDLGGNRIHLTYRVDRVDELVDGTILVLDYKTGGGAMMPREPQGGCEFSREYIRDQVKSFQMPLYVNYLRKYFPGRAVNAALYHLRGMELEYFLDAGRQAEASGILDNYLKALDFIVAEIYNQEIPFVNAPIVRP